MKVVLITLFMFISGLQILCGQVREIDSLNKLLALAGQDTNRVLMLVELAGNYQFFNSHTALSLTDEALKLSRKLNFKKGEVKAISRQGEVRRIRGELPQALEAELTAIQLSKTYNVPEVEAESLTFIAVIYFDLGEYRKALNYLFQAKNIYDNIANQLTIGIAQQFPPYVLLNIGAAYEKLNMIDSALYFEKLALNYPAKSEYAPVQLDILARIGSIESQQKNYKEALTHFRRILNITDITNDLLNRNGAQYQIAVLYSRQNRLDSAIHYARLAFITGVQSSSKTALLDAASLLAQLYKTKGDVDSAFYYQQTAMNTKDSLFGLDSFHKLQLLTLTEQQRLQQLKEEQVLSKARMQRTILLISIGVFLFIAIVLWRFTRQQKKANLILNKKNLEIKKQSESLKKTLDELKATQAQLVQSEKMASLGELTAGIAHEIQNPLNFVNNFAETNVELIDEADAELQAGNAEEASAILAGVKENEQKIMHHGKRADAIVKSMLEHSRASKGEKQPTNINALVDEYLRLSYHGIRAKDKSFNACIETNFDEGVGSVNVVPQDLGRVLLNLYNNAFFTVQEKSKKWGEGYQPTVSVATKKIDNKLEITVKDNGMGISKSFKDKIFQPFFTTKPTGHGTGLGLSLSYDIIRAHGGEIKVESTEGAGSTFSMQLPV